MGPPQGRQYDTTMPQFPPVRTPRSAPQPTATCANSVKPGPQTAPATVVGPGHADSPQSPNVVGAAAGETCSDVQRMGP